MSFAKTKASSNITTSSQLKRKTYATRSRSQTSLATTTPVFYFLVSFVEKYQNNYAIVTSKQIKLDEELENTGQVTHLGKKFTVNILNKSGIICSMILN